MVPQTRCNPALRRVGSLLVASLSLVPLVLAAPSAAQAQPSIDDLTLREKVGQLVMFSVDGTSLTETEAAAIRAGHLGGVILFAHNYSSKEQVRGLTRQIQKAARAGNGSGIGALITVDQEGGVVKRFPDFPPWYSHPEIGADGRDKLAFNQGRITGRELEGVGVNVNFAPVADLDIPPEHVMSSRSFGRDEYRVARLASAFARGLQSERVAATAKHFPGLGGATINSDNGPAYVYRSKAQLHNIDALPFYLTIGEGIKLVMVGHAMYVNDGGEIPASFSPYILRKRLRNEFQFSGVAISDALEAVAWYWDGDVPRACAATIEAGMDIALIVGDSTTALACADSIYKKVKAGKIPMARIDQAAKRVLALKAWIQA